MDLIIRNARLAGGPSEPLDIGIARRAHRRDRAQYLRRCAKVYDAKGLLACPGLIESHIHLDKSRIIDRCAPQERATLSPVFGVTPVKKTMTVEDVHARARATLEECIKHGTTRMRTQVEVDPGIGMRGFDGVEALIDEYKWAIDIEICVFPQEGLISFPGHRRTAGRGLEARRQGDRRRAALRQGRPRADPAASSNWRASSMCDIDMHLDVGHSANDMYIHLVRELTDKYKRGGRVVAGHMAKLSLLPPAEMAAMARSLADSGVAVTVLPATDLFLMGRDQDHSVRRGVADANVLCAHGVKCSLSSNNVLNPATPYGDCSLIRIANLYANVLQVDRPARVARMLRDAHDAFGARAQFQGLRFRGRQSGRRRHSQRADAGAGGGRNRPAAGGVQERPPDHGLEPAGADAAASAEFHVERREDAFAGLTIDLNCRS